MLANAGPPALYGSAPGAVRSGVHRVWSVARARLRRARASWLPIETRAMTIRIPPTTRSSSVPAPVAATAGPSVQRAEAEEDDAVQGMFVQRAEAEEEDDAVQGAFVQREAAEEKDEEEG